MLRQVTDRRSKREDCTVRVKDEKVRMEVAMEVCSGPDRHVESVTPATHLPQPFQTSRLPDM